MGTDKSNRVDLENGVVLHLRHEDWRAISAELDLLEEELAPFTVVTNRWKKKKKLT